MGWFRDIWQAIFGRNEMNAAVPTPVNVEVTPKLVQGNTVVCEIDPAPGTPARYVRGGVIKLPPNAAGYQLNFELQPGDVPGLLFDGGPNGAFWCDQNSCPGGPMNNSNNQLQNPHVLNGGRTLRVAATPQGPTNAVHYSLNFNNGGRYDPIIINN